MRRAVYCVVKRIYQYPIHARVPLKNALWRSLNSFGELKCQYKGAICGYNFSMDGVTIFFSYVADDPTKNCLFKTNGIDFFHSKIWFSIDGTKKWMREEKITFPSWGNRNAFSTFSVLSMLKLTLMCWKCDLYSSVYHLPLLNFIVLCVMENMQSKYRSI